MVRTVLLLLCLLSAAMATELNGAKRKKRAMELQPAIPIIGDIPHTVIPEGIALCHGTCGKLNKCQKFCDKDQEEYDNSQCLHGCKCCGPKKLTADCYFNGKHYKDGEQVEGICVSLVCRGGQWVSNGYIDQCCRICSVKDDPHFVSFDGLAFDFHGTCNYSITQEGVLLNPPFGVFGDFRPYGGWVSCVDVTTFKDNEHTVITMTYAGKQDVDVNGVSYTVTAAIAPLPGHPVLAWRVGDCIRFLGTQRLMVEYCWSGYWRQLYLYAHPALTDRLYGLCGHYNYYSPDDLTHRDLSVTPPTYVPNAFGNSWQTSVQSDTTCQDVEPMTSSPVSPGLPALVRNKRQDGGDPCLQDSYQKCYEMLSLAEYDGQSPTEEQLHIHSMFCATDLCAFQQNSDNQTDIDEYFRAIMDMLRTTVMHDVMATPGARPPNPDVCLPCNGTCAKRASCRFQCDTTEEEVTGTCSGKWCKCCRKKRKCNQRCGKKNKYRCKPIKKCKKTVRGKCRTPGCTCCRK